MTLKSIRARLYTFGPAILLCGLDQMFKLLATTVLKQPEKKLLPFFSFLCSRNPGSAFGLFSGYDPALLQLSTALLSGALLGYFWHNTQIFSYPYHLRIAAVIAGVMSNAWDRACYQGQVIDYLKLSLGHNHALQFNLSDVMLVAALSWWLVSCIQKFVEADNRARFP